MLSCIRPKIRLVASYIIPSVIARLYALFIPIPISYLFHDDHDDQQTMTSFRCRLLEVRLIYSTAKGVFQLTVCSLRRSSCRRPHRSVTTLRHRRQHTLVRALTVAQGLPLRGCSRARQQQVRGRNSRGRLRFSAPFLTRPQHRSRLAASSKT